ncbi:hypothetical protein MKY37_19405 [Psychrobacillus sp. FSL K6-2836]
MKKYSVYLSIHPPFQLMYGTSLQSDVKPKKINEAVLKIGD